VTPGALAHLASVLTNGFVLADLPLTTAEFHAVFDGALREAQMPARKANSRRGSANSRPASTT
jgi:hypothetical protein